MGDTQTIAIRRMLPADVAAVAELTRQLGYPSSESDIKRRHDLIKDRWDARLLVAQHAGHAVVGWVHVQITYRLESDPRAEIWGLVVAEGARKTGVGRRLMEAAEEWAVRLGVDVVVVRSNTMRVDARAFYERLGYTVTKTQDSLRKPLN